MVGIEADMPLYLSSAEAAARLGVSRQTLYAYVSRSLLAAETIEGQRERRYLASDIADLASQRRRGRKPKEVAKATLNWGLPVLESAITLIADGHLYYRGRDAIALAEAGDLEALAAHLWQCDETDAFGKAAPLLPAAIDAARNDLAHLPVEQSLLPLFTLASNDDDTAIWQNAPGRQAAGSAGLLRLMTACLLGTKPDQAPIHRQCAIAWKLDRTEADLLRRALILCADHELNASSFTARCVASTGASLRAAVIAGLAALTGPRHGGMTARVEAFWEEIGDDAKSPDKLRQRLARGERLPGFGHHLYPVGDVRAADLLQVILPQRPSWQRLIALATDLTGQHPSLDVALVAVRRHLRLPVGSAFGLFALGRTVGWIAHALEQRSHDDVIRPRAAYIGPAPSI